MPKARGTRHALTIHRTEHVPIVEVSGVCLRRGPDGRMSLIAIGDREAVAAWVILPDEDDEPWAWSQMDVARLQGSLMPAGDPQLEAVCADGQGRVLLLQEAPPRAELIDPAAERVVATFDLRVPHGHPLAEAWHDPDASRGEGAVLLADGHLLIAKEKDPPALIEFGPENARPTGFTPGSALPGGAAWPVEPGHHEYVALDSWMPRGELLEACADFSDLEVGPDRRLYLLSDKSASIARLPVLEPGTGTTTAERTWSLGKVDGKPEGLTFTRHGRAIVALDTRRAKSNLVVFDPPVVTWW
jgi:hypothetical protein